MSETTVILFISFNIIFFTWFSTNTFCFPFWIIRMSNWRNFLEMCVAKVSFVSLESEINSLCGTVQSGIVSNKLLYFYRTKLSEKKESNQRNRQFIAFRLQRIRPMSICEMNRWEYKNILEKKWRKKHSNWSELSFVNLFFPHSIDQFRFFTEFKTLFLFSMIHMNINFRPAKKIFDFQITIRDIFYLKINSTHTMVRYFQFALSSSLTNVLQ